MIKLNRFGKLSLILFTIVLPCSANLRSPFTPSTLETKTTKESGIQAEFIQVNYAKASDLALLLKTEKNSFLSARGTVSVDDRTNTLLVQDNAVKLQEIRELVQQLDIPIRQVLIESRLVFATDNFKEVLGINLESATQASAVTLARLKGGILLDMEIQALESEGLGKVIACPRLLTSHLQMAYIESGEEIPYQESTRGGGASIAFKKAVLRLEVTPQITPDNHIIMDLKVNQDSRGAVTANVPSINTRQLHTKVLVNNGETVVLGGIYQHNKQVQDNAIPFFCKLPLIGKVFRTHNAHDQRSELMIFVTPKIIQDGIT